MAKNEIKVGLKVDDKGNLKKTASNARAAGKELDNATFGADRYSKGQKGVAQATANSTKAFSKMQGGMGGMVGVYAEIASRVFALTAAFQFLKSASDVTNLIAGQEALGAVSGVAYKTLTQGLKDATDGQISYSAASKAAAIGTAAGLSPDQLNRLGKAAKNTSIALGRDLGDSFDRLIRGVTKAEPELLDELGIILRLETAKKNYAEQIGKTANKLTQFEQSQAVANEVLTQAEQKFGAIEKIMDPSAASLNRFLVSFDSLLNTIKTGVTTALRPVFDFLSGNTIALSAALLLLGKSILTAILPNFKEMGEASRDSMKRANMGVLEHQAHLENLQRTIEKTRTTMGDDRTQATAAAQKAFGKAAPTTTLKGGGALDFLMGSSDTKKAQLNADKALRHAEEQIRNSTEKRTGMFKHMNAQQVADMRASYAARSRIIAQEVTIHKKAAMTMGQHMDVLGAKAKVTFASMRAGMVSVGAAAATLGATLMSFLGWLGILAMVGSALYSAFRAIFPVPEAIKKAEEAAKKYIDSAKTLNSELEKMAKVTQKVNLQLDDLTSQRGGMAGQSNIAARLEEIKETSLALGESSKQAESLRTQFVFTLVHLSRGIGPEFIKFGRLMLDNSKLTAEQAAELVNLTNKYAEFGAATKALPGLIQEVNKSLTDITGLPKDINPLAELTNNVQKAAEASATALKGSAATLSELERKFKKTIGTVNERDAGTNLLKQQAFFKQQEQQNAYLEEFSTRLTKSTQEINENHEKAIALRKQEVIEKTRGLTIDDQIKNVSLETLKLQAKILDARNAQKVAQESFNAAEKKGGEEEKDNAKAGLSAANAKLEMLEHELGIQKEITDEKISSLTIEKELLTIRKGLNQVNIHGLKLARERKILEASITAFGGERAKILRDNKAQNLANQEAKAILEIVKARTDLEQISLGGKQQERAAAKNTLEVAKARLTSIKAEQVIHDNIAASLLNQLRTENELLGLTTEHFAFTSQQLAVQNKLVEAYKKGVDITPQFVEDTKALVAENAKLTKEFNMQATVRDSLGSGLSNSLASLIKNEESSVKDAIKGLVKGVFEAIADQLAKQLSETLLESFFKKQDPSAAIAVAMNTGSATASTTISGGMTAAAATGATTIAGAITGAFATAAGVISAAIVGGSKALGGNPGRRRTPTSGSGVVPSSAEVVASVVSIPVAAGGLIAEAVSTGVKEAATAIGTTSTEVVSGDGITEIVTTASKVAVVPFTSAFGDFIANLKDGEISFGSSLKNLFIDIGTDFRGIFSRMLSAFMRMVSSVFGSGGGDGGFLSKALGFVGGLFGGPQARSGGIMTPSGKLSGYSTGGIARGPGAGYPALLHGTEAVIPLPNGRSIPVDMPQNAGEQNNSVVVNISMDGSTESKESSSPDMENLGAAVAKAVQRELQTQKRSGGILSPFGVA